jgi:peptidoglycan/xylan/chitin deacetylase (PgdA/CDA1 family)
VERSGTAVLTQLVADGHVVANHTQTHPNLTTLQPAQVVSELEQTDAIIAPFVPANRFMFRAPFGFYDANVYNALQASAMSKYVGHIEWEIGGQRTATTGADFACWQGMQGPAITAKACGDLYIQEINADTKGIVLMHDADYGSGGANNDPNTGVGNTVIMVKYMVPLLKAAGYTFVRVDEVPDIAALLPPLPPTPDAGDDGSTPIPVPTTTTTVPPPPPPCP